MVAGHLREQNGYFQMILSWKGADGKRKSKSISTGLTVKGNKKRAEAMLLKTRKEFNPENLLENADMPFHVFLNKWLKPNRRAAAKHTICRLVRLKATFVLTLDKSLGTGIHFHTWIFVIVEWADRHSIATHTNTI